MLRQVDRSSHSAKSVRLSLHTTGASPNPDSRWLHPRTVHNEGDQGNHDAGEYLDPALEIEEARVARRRLICRQVWRRFKSGIDLGQGPARSTPHRSTSVRQQGRRLGFSAADPSPFLGVLGHRPSGTPHLVCDSPKTVRRAAAQPGRTAPRPQPRAAIPFTPIHTCCTHINAPHIRPCSR